MSYDEPKILSSQLNQFCLMGADVGQTGTTDEASDGQVQFDPPARTRQIANDPRIAAVNTMGGHTAFGTPAISGLTICDDDDHICAVVHCLYVLLGRYQIGKPKLGSHGAVSPLETKPIESQTSSRLSQTPVTTPIDTSV